MQTTPQNSTTPSLLLAFELGGSCWRLAFAGEPAGSIRHRPLALKGLNAPGILERVFSEIAAAKARFGLPGDAPVFSCYEAGRDGFWIHRALREKGVANVIIEPASLLVDRRARRAKTDRLDVESLLGSLFRHVAGEKVWRVVRVPTLEDEDLRQLSRDRDRLVKERTRHINRIKSLLNLEGIKTIRSRPTPKAFDEAVDGFRRSDGSPLGSRRLAAIKREIERFRLVHAQIKCVEDEIDDLVSADKPASAIVEKAKRLAELAGIGSLGAMALSSEFYGWREFENRRQVGSLAGLTDSPWKSDGIDRQQGISKAGNAGVRRLAIQLAWGWLRFQPDSALSKWLRTFVGVGKKKRLKRVAIVALARKLLVALWHFLEHGVIPDGAIFRESERIRRARAKRAKAIAGAAV